MEKILNSFILANILFGKHNGREKMSVTRPPHETMEVKTLVLTPVSLHHDGPEEETATPQSKQPEVFQYSLHH